MPLVKVIGKGLVKFPDSMSLDEIKTTLGEKFSSGFKTGEGTKLFYAKNTEKAPRNVPGMDFGQTIEPSGDYLVVDTSSMGSKPAGAWNYGTVEYKNPLVLEHKSTGSTGWKKDLSDMYGGKTWKALANAIKKDGYDGIITVDDAGDLSESVNLFGKKEQGATALAGFLGLGAAAQSDESEAGIPKTIVTKMLQNFDGAGRKLIRDEGYKADPLPNGGYVLYGPDGSPITSIKNKQQALDMTQEAPQVDDYRIQHRAPSIEGRNTLDDLSDVYPDDVYDPRVAGQYYGHGDAALDRKTAQIIAKYKGQPEKEITVYRAVPKGVTEINPGDWVTVNKDYAKSHGGSWVDDGNFDIISKKVKAKEVAASGDSIHEQGYNPLMAAPFAFSAGALITPEQAEAANIPPASTGTIDAARSPLFMGISNALRSVDTPIGKPFEGLADWAEGVAYQDDDKVKRAAIGALDLL